MAPNVPRYILDILSERGMRKPDWFVASPEGGYAVEVSGQPASAQQHTTQAATARTQSNGQ